MIAVLCVSTVNIFLFGKQNYILRPLLAYQFMYKRRDPNRLERQRNSLTGHITFLKPQKSAGVIDIFDKMVKKVGGDSSSVEKIAEYKLSFADDYDKAFLSSVFWHATLQKNAFNTTTRESSSAVENYFATSPNTIFSRCPREGRCSAALIMRYRL
jgi:hypothetical protein